MQDKLHRISSADGRWDGLSALSVWWEQCKADLHPGIEIVEVLEIFSKKVRPRLQADQLVLIE
jgi:hypothetical protein